MPAKNRLDRAAVVAAAAEIADAQGLEALTLGALAQKLAIRPPSLYNHVAGLPGLRRELALLGLRELAARMAQAAIGRSGMQAVHAVAQAYREYVHERPNVYATTLRAPETGDLEMQAVSERIFEIVRATLSAFDLSGEDEIHAMRALRSIVHGFATLELAGGFGLPLDRDESFRRLVEQLFAVEKAKVSRG